MVLTKKLYELNPYQVACQARVLSEQVGSEGEYLAVLDQTVFYPTGGGQPHDLGQINDIHVTNVYKQSGVIYHVLQAPLQGVKQVTLMINWQRRFDHMQQHAGQHVLSRAFEIIVGGETIGFHLGEDSVTIDLNLNELTEEDLVRVEDLANKIAGENKEITTELINAEELSDEARAKIPELEDVIRIVAIQDFDSCACSGTHPNSSLEIGTIKILGIERYKQKIRVTFVCGARAFRYFRSFQKELLDTAAVLKTNWSSVRSSTSRLVAEKEELEKQKKELAYQLLISEAEGLRAKSEAIEDFKLSERVFVNRDFSEIKQLAQMVAGAQSSIAVFANLADGKVQFILQRSEELKIPMNECLKSGLALIDGKGGGNEKSAQGGGGNAEQVAEVMEHLKGFIRAQLT